MLVLALALVRSESARLPVGPKERSRPQLSQAGQQVLAARCSRQRGRLPKQPVQRAVYSRVALLPLRQVSPEPAHLLGQAH